MTVLCLIDKVRVNVMRVRQSGKERTGNMAGDGQVLLANVLEALGILQNLECLNVPTVAGYKIRSYVTTFTATLSIYMTLDPCC